MFLDDVIPEENPEEGGVTGLEEEGGGDQEVVKCHHAEVSFVVEVKRHQKTHEKACQLNNQTPVCYVVVEFLSGVEDQPCGQKG